MNTLIYKYVACAAIVFCSREALAARIRGMIIRDGEPAPSVKVMLHTNKGQQFPATFTDKRGFYYYEAVPEHDIYLLKVSVTEKWAVDYPVVVYSGKFTDITPIRISSAQSDGIWLGDDEVRKLIETYWTLLANKDVARVAALHADPCDFYDDGNRPRAYIQARKQEYVNFYPSMQLKAQDIQVFPGFNNGEKSATFTLSYNLTTKAGRLVPPGTTRQAWTLSKGDRGTVIISCKELLKRR